MPRDFSPLRETVFDLYLERDRLPWYFRTLATLSAWLALGGYILFAEVFTSAQYNLKISHNALTGLAITLLAAGYVGLGLTAWYSKSLLFRFECVLLPTLTSSFMGLFAIVMNHALHKTFPTSHNLIYVPLVASIITTLVSAALAILLYRRLAHIRATDNRRRDPSRTSFSYIGSSPLASRAPREYNTTGDPASNIQLLPQQIPEDEAQRQQLLRLLLKRESGRTPSPDATAGTYRIDLPSPLSGSGSHHYLSVPTNEPGARTRSGSLPTSGLSGRWGLGSLIKKNRSRSPSFKDPRERRREEIERGGSAESMTPLAGTPMDPWTSPQPYSPFLPTQGARYA